MNPPPFKKYDIPSLHSSIAPTRTLLQERRALCQFATELLDPRHPEILTLDVIDSPLARSHIGHALAGRVRFNRSQLVSINAVTEDATQLVNLHVASQPEANLLLTGALETVRVELNRQTVASTPPILLTKEDGNRFTSAHAVLRSGMELALLVSPGLVEDLLGHITLLGIFDEQCTDRLASASSRSFPGLILLSTSSAVAVAEAIVHEGAHQKLFELAITHDFLDATSDQCPPFYPPWRSGDHWPLEQALAAFHAYCCLEQFGQHLDRAGLVPQLGSDSLIPFSSQRSDILGKWLSDRINYLGTDAQKLIDGLLGRSIGTATKVDSRSGALIADEYIVDPDLKFRRCGPPARVLVGRPSRPPEIFWVSEDAANVLDLLQKNSFNLVVNQLARSWGLTKDDCTDQLSTIISELSASNLVRARRKT